MSSHGGGFHSSFNEWTGFSIKSLDSFTKSVGDWGISRGLVLTLLFIGEYLWLMHLVPYLPLYTFNWLAGTAPIWMPVLLVIGAWRVWVWYAQSLFLSGRNPVLLELKVPREINKSPRAMEVAISLFSISSGETTFIHRGWKGQVRPFFSFEMASFGGEIHFYIWTWKNYKSEIESAIYSQYPEVELHEVEDYASKFQYDPAKHNVYCTDWRLEAYHSDIDNASMRVNIYQPKSYIDFELDKDPKDEYRVDPLATIIEFMSNIEPQEQIWSQIIFRKCGNQGVLWQHEQDHEWMHAVEHEIEKIRTQAAIVSKEIADEEMHAAGYEASDRPPSARPSWRQSEQLRSLERHLGKYPFEAGARGVYITTGHMHGPTYTGTRWLWKPLGNPHYMSHLRPRRWHNPYDYPWQDIADFRWSLHAKRFFDAYRRRSFFHTPWITPTNIFTNETLATLWHPPSSSVQAPGLRRIPSKKATAPGNLPK